MIHLVCYDICDPKRLSRVAKTLEEAGLRIQYSFFECDLDPEALKQLIERLRLLIDEEVDNLKVYPLCSDCIEKAEIDGEGRLLDLATWRIL